MDVDKVSKRKLPRIGGCFRRADGCLAPDAAFLRPYSNNPENRGFLTHTQEEVNSFASGKPRRPADKHARDRRRGCASGTNAYEALDYPRKDHRHIIIHATLWTRNGSGAADRAFSLPLSWHSLLGARASGDLDNILGKERSDAVMPLKS